MNYNIICLLLSLAIMIILVYSIIKQKELFQNGPATLNNVKSLISIIDGTMINVEKVSDVNNNNEIYIPIDKSGNYLALDDNGHIKISKIKDESTQWFLSSGIDEYTEIYEIVHNWITYGPVGASDDKQTPIRLLYNSNTGNLFSTYLDDTEFKDYSLRNHQWRLSTKEVPRKQLKIVDIYNSPIGPIKSNYAPDDPNSISLNLNVNNDILKKILGNNSDNANSNVTSKVCEDYLSKDAVCSICPGCCNDM